MSETTESYRWPAAWRAVVVSPLDGTAAVPSLHAERAATAIAAPAYFTTMFEFITPLPICNVVYPSIKANRRRPDRRHAIDARRNPFCAPTVSTRTGAAAA